MDQRSVTSTRPVSRRIWPPLPEKNVKPKIRREKIRLAIRRQKRENSAAAEFVIGYQNYLSFIGHILTPTVLHMVTTSLYWGVLQMCECMRPNGNRCISPYPQSILLLLFTQFTKIMWSAAGQFPGISELKGSVQIHDNYRNYGTEKTHLM